jgi:Ice-binding-like
VVAPSKLYAADLVGGTTSADLGTAVLSMEAAYLDAAGRTATSAATTDVGSGTLISLTFNAVPGGVTVYEWGSAVNIPTNLTFNGSATDVFILKVAGTLDMAAAKSVILIGGALPQNIFWQVTDVVTIGANTHFEGIILGQTIINFGNLASINGRLLAQTAVNLDATTVTQP